MSEGVKTIIYPVKDLAAGKALFSKLLGVDPYVDAPYYVGFRVGDQEFGLDPHGHQAGATAYYEVADINGTLQRLLDEGAETVQEIRDVGEGTQIASVKDDAGNIIGLKQLP